MSKTFTVRIKAKKARLFIPVKRADVFGDKRTKRVRTRNDQSRMAIKEFE